MAKAPKTPQQLQRIWQKFPDTLTVPMGLDEDDSEESLQKIVADALQCDLDVVPPLHIAKRSVDARRKRVHFSLSIALLKEPHDRDLGAPHPRDVKTPARVIVVGDGPAGLFCAYELARHGIASIVLDRGKQVQPRRFDLRALYQERIVPDDSNYCFGEGGAGTYSDGKLYTRSTKRGDVRDVLEIFAAHNAPMDILVDAHPHIGSNRLPMVVTAMRERLEAVGVEFRFESRVVKLLSSSPLNQQGKTSKITGVQLADGTELAADAVVLATGHSARDVYQFLDEMGVALEAKPFALGVRIEHPQPFINKIQHGAAAGHPKLASASYSLAHTEDRRGVFSFCMCPGGFIVPASTETGNFVVNGMSLKRRDSPYANSGMVVAIEVEDAEKLGLRGPMACLEVQKRVEAAAWIAGGGNLVAPAARATDFVAKRGSTTLPSTSYRPGMQGANLWEVLDASGLPIAHRLAKALTVFDQSMRGYLSNEAVLLGVESRTSSPVRIIRDKETLMSPSLYGLYPCGEGGGFAGGIVSAALDGMRVARQLLQKQLQIPLGAHVAALQA